MRLCVGTFVLLHGLVVCRSWLWMSAGTHITHFSIPFWYLHSEVAFVYTELKRVTLEVGSLKLYVSFGKEPYKKDDILQKTLVILRSLLIVATP